METISVYKSLCDVQRMRILNLLSEGPLCVCHLMEVLEEDQVKISKQLRYLKELGMVEGERHAQWMVYRLAEPENALLRANLECLQSQGIKELNFEKDAQTRATIIERLREEGPPCAEVVTSCCGVKNG